MVEPNVFSDAVKNEEAPEAQRRLEMLKKILQESWTLSRI